MIILFLLVVVIIKEFRGPWESFIIFLASLPKIGMLLLLFSH